VRRPPLDQKVGDPRTAGGTPARVLVADSHAWTRLGIRRALEERGFALCGEASDALEAVDLVARLSPDVCLIDLELPDVSDAIAAIATIARGPTILVLTSSCDDSGLLDCLCAGAAGYVVKDAAPERLARAIESALQGEVSISRSVLSALVAEMRDSRQTTRRQHGPAVALTTREREVLDLLQRGLRTAEIARRLFIEQVTVRSHVCSILKKLSVPNRQAAIRLLDETDGSRGNR
jgi:two-component system, NarL family, nitrate/nitrite response regulator NarL